MLFKILVRIILGLIIVLLAACRTPKVTSAGDNAPVIIIFYDPAVGEKPLLKAVKAYGSPIVYRYRQLHGMAVKVPPRKSLRQALQYYQKVKGVLSARPDGKMHLMQDGRM